MARAGVTWEVREGRAFWDGRSLVECVPQLVDDLVAEFDPVEVVLFGSVARGDDDGDSDIDVLVVLDVYEPGSVFELKLRARRAVSAPVPFDVSFADEHRYEVRARIAGTCERVAATEGRVLYRRG